MCEQYKTFHDLKAIILINLAIAREQTSYVENMFTTTKKQR